MFVFYGLMLVYIVWLGIEFVLGLIRLWQQCPTAQAGFEPVEPVATPDTQAEPVSTPVSTFEPVEDMRRTVYGLLTVHELYAIAREAGLPRYKKLRRPELVEALAVA